MKFKVTTGDYLPMARPTVVSICIKFLANIRMIVVCLAAFGTPVARYGRLAPCCNGKSVGWLVRINSESAAVGTAQGLLFTWFIFPALPHRSTLP